MFPKIFLFLLSIFLLYSAKCETSDLEKKVQATTYLLEETILDLVNNLKKLTEGFDPVTISENVIVVKGFSLKDFTIAGLSKWDVKNLEISLSIIPPRVVVNFELEVNDLSLNGKYSVEDLQIFSRNLQGSGTINGFLKGFVLNFHLSVFTYVDELDIKLDLEKSRLLLENLEDDGVPIDDDIDDLVSSVPFIFKYFGDIIEKYASGLMKDTLNKIFESILGP